MVCPICRGKSEVGVFCSNCYLKRNLEVEVPPIIEVPCCKQCGSCLLRGTWLKGLTGEEALLRAANDSVKTNMKKLEKAGILKMSLEKKDYEYILIVTITLGDSEVKKTAVMRLKNSICPDCSRVAGGYYEAVIQLRGIAGEKEVDNIVKDVEKHKDKFAFVGEIKKVHGGYDIYLGSKKSAEKIVKNFKKEKAEIKKSFRQAGFDRQTSKSKSRFFYLVRI